MFINDYTTNILLEEGGYYTPDIHLYILFFNTEDSGQLRALSLLIRLLGSVKTRNALP